MTAAPHSADRFQHERGTPTSPIRTFHPRRSPLGLARTEALDRLWPRYGFSVHDPALGSAPLREDGTLDTERLFGRTAPLVLEIGSGMGEAVAAMAAADPRRDYLAVEAHLPGIAHLLTLLDGGEHPNIRIAHGDGLDLARTMRPSSLDAVHVFFPDPWPKVRHHKRRIVSAPHVALLASLLRPGGVLHVATDWAPYAEVMLGVIADEPSLHNPHAGPAPRPAHRPVTKFERRGIELGHEIVDILAVRAEG
ncbi:tRNA (guanosine(46)-N7)-methyltransferase TrmB [Actinotalea sp.]|uniref:tRNA (guanosine(46)-N7)-methyltransferase TrmB n=1 Tax=Actinotalea sp. TaxID=1872145 RepID=UPI0035657232